MVSRTVVIGLASSLLIQPAHAARAVPVKVDAKGRVRIPAATLKQLGVTPDRTGSIWVVFKLPARAQVRPPRSLQTVDAAVPPRVLVPVDKDYAMVPRTRIDRKVYVPGAPGTKYLATGSGHELTLRLP